MTLTKLGDVSAVAKTLVEVLNDVLQNLDATGSVDSSVVHAGRAQTLAKFFYDRNDHGRGEVLLSLDIQLRLHDTLRNYARTLEIANKKVSETTVSTARFPSIISLPMADTSRRPSVATISSCAAETKQLLVSNQTQNKDDVIDVY